MTPDDRSNLVMRGQYFLIYSLTPLTVVTLLSGALDLSLESAQVALSLLSRRTQTWASRIQFVIVCLGMIGLTGYFILEVCFVVIYLKSLTMNGGDIEGGMEDYFFVQAPKLFLAGLWLYFIPVCLSSTVQKHTRFLSKMDYQNRQRFQLKRVLWVLVDAGAVLALLKLICVLGQIISFQSNKSGVFACAIDVQMHTVLLLVYPALTISLISGPFSIVGSYESTHLMSPVSMKPV
ncbi:hypothetical protein H0H93_009788 [Arthromyces matolae]|nr:hypothetical protein H0H93_009788 [Arthromyces matolae]